MLDNAYKHEEELKTLLLDTWYDDKYKYYNSSVYNYPFELDQEKGDWNYRWFASLDSNEDVIGVMGYSIDRTNDAVDAIMAVNFSDNKVVFGNDLMQMIDDIFCKFNFRKITFTVVVGNPIERSYDRLVKLVGGKIVGVYEHHVKLMDNQYYNEKIYEVMWYHYKDYKDKKEQELRQKHNPMPPLAF